MAQTLEQKLCKRSFGYNLLRTFLVGPAFYLFYRKISVIEKETVPKTGPVIFTPNHQNALMDAIAILCTRDHQPVFVARADIFKKPAIIRFLHFLRILPIFRKRDGGNASDNNQETFDLVMKVLDSKQSIGIMPEGIHNKYKRLQMLQKGIFRLAMQVQEKHGNNPMVKIIPVGIEYANTNKFRSDLIIRYGKTIDVSDFYDLYVENPAKAFKQMQDVLFEKIKEGMINISNEEHYSTIEYLRVIYQKCCAKRLRLNLRNAEQRLYTQQTIIAALEKYAQTNKEEMSELSVAVEKYKSIINKFNLRDWVIERQPYSFFELLGRSIFSLFVSPFWILGMLFNYLPYKLTAYASRQIKDPQFLTSVQYVAGMILFPIYYLIMAVLMVIFIPCIWGKIIMPLLLIPLGLFAFKYYLSMKKLFARFCFWREKRKNKSNNLITEAIELRKYIFNKMEGILA